jgi:DNA-directed RNA polymerase subunit delta
MNRAIFRLGKDEGQAMGGNQVPPHATDNWDEEGYDEAQRAEIVEATQDGPSNGTIMTDIPLGLDDPDAIASEDELSMVDDEIGEEDDDADLDEDDLREDDLQDDLDDEDVDADELDDELDDGDDTALRP